MRLAAFPKCFLGQIMVERSMSVFDWIEMALDLYDGFLETVVAGEDPPGLRPSFFTRG